MSVPGYESYRDSGVEWLGEVPSHWKVDRLKASVAASKGGVWGEEADGGPDDIICLRVADFDRKALSISLGNPTVRKVLGKDRDGRLVRRGDLLLEKSGGGEKQPVGAVVLYDHAEEAVCSNFVARIELAAHQHPEFWRYVHAAAYARGLSARSLNQTSGIQNLDQTRYLDERAPFPPLAEQLAIATFLDRETGKIDALVEAQRRLIELLKEKRKAVIFQAVTKGLNPAAPMKASGVEWLGEVPAHWEVARTQRYLTVRSGDMISSASETDAGVPIIGGNGIRAYTDASNTPGDTIVIGRVGALCGCVHHIEEPFWASEHAFRVVEKRLIDKRYLFHLLGALNLNQFAIKTAQPLLNTTIVENQWVAVPTIEEQSRIGAYLDRALANFERLSNEAETAIALLQERRTALISAAVTGKIDARGLVPEKAEAA